MSTIATMNAECGMMNEIQRRDACASSGIHHSSFIIHHFRPSSIHHSSFIIHHLRLRRGLTILEVLISIFVLAVGILSLTALIPLAQVQVSDAAALDRAAALGRAAFRDLQIRGYLHPQVWVQYDPSYASNIGVPILVNPPGRFILPYRYPDSAVTPEMIAPPFVLDPLSIAHPANQPANAADLPEVYRFPYGPLQADAPPLARFTVNLNPTFPTQLTPPPPGAPERWSASIMPFALADRVFRSVDDLVLIRPSDATLRPTLGFSRDGTSNTPVQDSYRGALSWFATVSPTMSEIMGVTATSESMPREYQVSVVAVLNRDVVADTAAATVGNFPPERMLLADIVSGGQSGGEIILKHEAGVTNKQSWLACQAGQWIMLSGWVRDATLTVDMNPGLGGANDRERAVIGWYRIRGAAEPVQNTTTNDWERRLTVEGPDWAVFSQDSIGVSGAHFLDADGTGLPTAYATLVTGAIAVYQKAMRFEGRSPYAR